MKLNIDEMITLQTSLSISIAQIKSSIEPKDYTYTSLGKFRELKKRVDKLIAESLTIYKGV